MKMNFVDEQTKEGTIGTASGKNGIRTEKENCCFSLKAAE